MEEVKQLIIEYWPAIVEWVLLLLSYFLIYLYKKTFTAAKTNLTTVFKENVAIVKKTDKAIKVEYEKAIKRIQLLEKKLDRAEHILNILIGDAEYEETTDVSTNDD